MKNKSESAFKRRAQISVHGCINYRWIEKPVQIRLKTNPVIDRFCKIYNDTISTTRLAGGLLCAYKARVTGQALKGPLNERSPSAPLSLAQALARAF
ncbi:MAG: hypothetical protein SOU32_05510, partial [Lachnospiraceae bacterium]|nr:hypothetical protein [Lachnospiraceae bacterium]